MRNIINNNNTQDPLRFVEEVRKNFSFLENRYGFNCVKISSTSVYYESDKVFIHIYHDQERLAYEIDLGIGRIKKREELHNPYSMGFIIGLYSKQEAKMYRPFIAKTQESVKIGVKNLVMVFRKYAENLLEGDRVVFNRLYQKREELIGDDILKDRLKNIRSKAETAFKEKNFYEVIKLYESIQDSLTAIEIKKLEYARKR